MKKQIIFQKFIYAIVALIISVSTIISGQGVLSVSSAQADFAATRFDETNVLDDLEQTTVDGEKFNLTKYNFDSKKETQVFSFIEYCYSFYENLQSNYGLYIYVYNPRGELFAVESPLNKLSLRVGEAPGKGYRKYPLRYLNRSVRKNFEGLFYKFKVELTPKEKKVLLDELNSSTRVYTLSGVELATSESVNATEVAVSTVYRYSGYSAGYGSKTEDRTTLTCTSEQSDTLSVKPYATVYRPDGTNGKTEYTQDSLHSVYFAVPNKFIKRYGEMSAVHATWLNAVLAPALVTGNEEAWNAIMPYLGKNIGKGTKDLEYHYFGGLEVKANSGMGGATSYTYGYGYNQPELSACMFFPGENSYNDKGGHTIETLYNFYFSGTGMNSADSYIVSSETIKANLLKNSRKYGGELINGKYSRVLFENVDAEPVDINIRSDETFDLTSELISKTWWDKLWGLKGEVSSTVFDGIRAIYPVTESDLNGTPEEVCKRLYISAADYEHFKQYFDTNKVMNTVYLFRYQVSDYVAQEATLYRGNGVFDFKEADTNAYFFSETIHLDFDIIDVTFSNEEKETVIPVVMTPIDVITDATSPVYTTTDKQNSLRKIILGLALLILFLFIFRPILMLLIQLVIWIVRLPFKLIGGLFKKGKGG